MNILVLGASSEIGASIAKKFAQDNHLFLIGRNTSSLQAVSEQALLAKAITATNIVCDLSKGCEPILEQINTNKIDIIINAASATSRLRDSEISSTKSRAYIMTDLISFIELTNYIITAKKENSSKLRIIFISSVLAYIDSPDRTIYASLKKLQQSFLNRIVNENPSLVQLMTVIVGCVIPLDGNSPKPEKIATKTLAAFNLKKRSLSYGITGRILLLAHNIHPPLSRLIIKAYRILGN